MKEVDLSEFEGTNRKSPYRVLKVVAYGETPPAEAMTLSQQQYNYLGESLQSGEKLCYIAGTKTVAVLALFKDQWKRNG